MRAIDPKLGRDISDYQNKNHDIINWEIEQGRETVSTILREVIEEDVRITKIKYMKSSRGSRSIQRDAYFNNNKSKDKPTNEYWVKT